MTSAIGSALLVIGLSALVLHLPWSRWVLTPIRAAGAMTLTLYTAHVLWIWRIVSTHDDSVEPWQGGYPDWLLQVVVLCAVATVWQQWVGRGPLEQVVRWVSVPTWLTPGTRKNAPVQDRGVDSAG